ncbi:tenascin-X [Vitiosangium sp. GDMCC 1.1324]|uniref:tenascin-X n=1 Tax=Vitiosangium sp. (strain GDMCC 1.1324) TaxID=2138576 RepID=UPI000D3869D3|nr:tenascin-X [Vitiosangium sp. GDMCC 1.1324]PTL77066.1 tenascin-X [Vitiosangium sp. GDMCC 1.1324]
MKRETRADGWGWSLVALLLTGPLGACREERPPLVDSSSQVRFSQEALAFPATYVGASREGAIRVVSAGRSPVRMTWNRLQGPFAVEGLPERVGPEEEPSVRVRFTPGGLGTFSATLVGTDEGGRTVTLRLSGEGRPVPPCPTPVTCHRFTFDAARELCVEEVLEDGTGCDPGNACVLDAVCRQGQCKGHERVCDDGNACTTDACSPLDGCQSVPAPPCPGDGACQEGWCEPSRGCQLRPAPNGTFCGEERGCDLADVCVEGACVKRNPPDGFVCAPASPCQGEGRCHGSECTRPPASVLVPDWTYDAAAQDRKLHDLLVGPGGDVTLVGFFERPVLDAAGDSPVEAQVTGRRCMLWNERLLCMDLPQQGKVSLMERATAAPRWSFDLARARPELAQKASTIFLARLAVMAPDRLAALFEAYPAGQDSRTPCRLYYLVVLDAAGGMVSAQLMEDPLLSECNHPHPFGLASDTAGDLYVTFSPTLNSVAPLRAGAPTLVMAFSSDGVPRWRRTLPFPGGELGLVRGLLMPEGGSEPLRTSDGEPVGTLPLKLGRAVATHQVLVPSPEGATVNPDTVPPESPRLRGYAVPGLEPAWMYQLPKGASFVSKELRLGTWPEGGARRTMVLGFAAEDSKPVLVGVRAEDGSEAFRCELGYTPRTVPQLFELGPGTLTLMDGATTCGECDPPFADSEARFQRFTLPKLEPAEAPWPGTFGGPGHDHHEDPVGSAP